MPSKYKKALSYTDCEEFLNSALENPLGAVTTHEKPSDAVRFNQRCNMFRKAMRDATEDMYQPGDKRIGHCQYDVLIISRRGFKVYAQRVKPPKSLAPMTEKDVADVSHTLAPHQNIDKTPK